MVVFSDAFARPQAGPDRPEDNSHAHFPAQSTACSSGFLVGKWMEASKAVESKGYTRTLHTDSALTLGHSLYFI